MIIVKIIGGLGNQMFGYAYAKALQQKGYEVKIDISAFETYKLHGGYQLDKYYIDLDYSTKDENNRFYKNTIFHKVLKRLRIDFFKIIRENSLLFDKKLLEIKDNRYLDGYFQCEKYFKDIREVVLKQFTINQEFSNYTKDVEKKILNSQNSCSIHIRRGDFVNNNNILIHGACSIEYYNKSMRYLEDKIANISYFVFSDDIEWVKNNLSIQNGIYIDCKKKRIPHEDIYLMSLCNHNIIANSTFGWWGAWLNQNKNKIVVAPKIWFADKKLQEQSKDIVCEEWIKI
ncbi:alpha-1,2-fucosyltransferase [Campylobacter sp. RM9328]|uniref:alpha-1,2-fucosyltransferase n=1 Tax=Campylobacter sp. RM9328 TaxID=1705720 RepID=UPI0014729145|nr:alpha-1,2-fucosyltransferase [Campylobacter sp. RM9328]